ncbi:tail protein X [Enterobacter asburiae]|uniref:tail protein X n=1 Tax=Enterobacter asburiae TaxID=61645 RepID=UPI003F575F1E
MNVTATQGDTIDLMCWHHYGKTRGVTERVYAANPGLCEKGPLLPAGTQVWMPEVPEQTTAEIVQLWD